MRPSTQKCLFRALTSLLVIAAVALQQGCGGGGSSKPLAPTLGLSVQATKTFHFSWKDVSGESEYRLMENPDGASGYRQVATLAAGSTQYDLTVSLPQRINARYLLQACNKKGCTDSKEVAVSGTLATGIGYFKASDTTKGAEFGRSVALSADGATLAVGAYAGGVGKVYVFTKGNGGWSEAAKLAASNAGPGDEFGCSVALSADGTLLAVGARYEDSSTDSLTSSGAAYLFSHSSGKWAEQAYLNASDAVDYALFGDSVALSGDGTTLAVGAQGAANSTGAVYLFRNEGSWVEKASVTASDGVAYDGFGYSVALSGDGSLLAVGAPYKDLGAGAVYLLSDSGGSWAEQAYSGTLSPGSFGYAVALSADGVTLAVGAAGGNGAAYLFSKSNNSWTEQTSVTPSNAGSAFGGSVALSQDGSLLGVGASWEKSSAIGINGDETDTTADQSGAVYLFRNSGGGLVRQAYVKASNTEAQDFFGKSVALSAAGDTLAVGSYEEDSDAVGINGDQTNNSASNSGAVYLY